MRLLTRIISLLGICLVSLLAVQPVLAFPPLPSSFYGTVKVNAANVPDGTPVTASINDKVFASGQTLTYQANSVYTLDIPGDDSTTTAVEGGREGDTIVFTIGGTQADQTGIWKSGTNINLDLTTTTTATLVPPQDTPTPLPTQTAINIVIPPTAIATKQAPATPTQSASLVVLPATATPHAQVTPPTAVPAQASPPPTARASAVEAIPTLTNPENASANSTPTIVAIGILVVIGILITILWLTRKRKP
jgi:hypothetical protein